MNKDSNGFISVIIVSHGHKNYVEKLLKQIIQSKLVKEIILIKNLAEEISYNDPKVKEISNSFPKSYSENINFGLNECSSEFVCLMNPDIFFKDYDPDKVLSSLLSKLSEDSNYSIVSPIVLDKEGFISDFARDFPCVTGVFYKFFKHILLRRPIKVAKLNMTPDWVGGMFMFFKASTIRDIGGFSINFRLYYEDVDLCYRLKLSEKKICVDDKVSVIHYGQRNSWKSPKYFYWHISSMLKFFIIRYFK